MSENNKHTALIRSKNIADEAEKRNAAKRERKEDPLLHMAEDMRKLSTP